MGLLQKTSVDEKMDIWALGCITYSLMYNRHIYPDGFQKENLTN